MPIVAVVTAAALSAAAARSDASWWSDLFGGTSHTAASGYSTGTQNQTNYAAAPPVTPQSMTTTRVVVPNASAGQTPLATPGQTVITVPNRARVAAPNRTTVMMPNQTFGTAPGHTTVVPPTSTNVVPPTSTTVVPPTSTTVAPAPQTTYVPPGRTTVMMPSQTFGTAPSQTTVVPPTAATVMAPQPMTVMMPTRQTLLPASRTTVYAPTTVYQPNLFGRSSAVGQACVPQNTVRPEDQPWFPNIRMWRPLDCFRRRGDPCAPPMTFTPPAVTIAAPAQANPCAPAPCLPCNPCPPCSPCDPCGSCSPCLPCNPCNPCGTVTCQRPTVTVCQYVPNGSYRSIWARVPVTALRPTTTIDPITRCPVTVMQPCVTYRWQVRRVPRFSLQALFSRPVRPTTTAAYYTYPTATCPSACAAPAVCGPSGGYGMVSPGSMTTLPGAAATAPSLQTIPAPVSPSPLQPIPQNSVMPGPAAGTTPGTVVAPVPADIKPSLPQGTTPGSGSAAPVPRESTQNRLELKKPGNEQLEPIPDPDSEREAKPVKLAPPWLDPGDRTAAAILPQRWASTQIDWPARRTATRTASHVAAEPPVPQGPAIRPTARTAPPPVNVPYDSGWLPVYP